MLYFINWPCLPGHADKRLLNAQLTLHKYSLCLLNHNAAVVSYSLLCQIDYHKSLSKLEQLIYLIATLVIVSCSDFEQINGRLRMKRVRLLQVYKMIPIIIFGSSTWCFPSRSCVRVCLRETQREIANNLFDVIKIFQSQRKLFRPTSISPILYVIYLRHVEQFIRCDLSSPKKFFRPSSSVQFLMMYV